uniref:AlNc14C76G5099 protein n=1 Tax=Albugo laibachii Nc14 TaxID=890382 RepID=F0WEP9_9STRA|nr:AlNc14C76G5099 [Albugo laibachii Nc14]|eukprot:CCA19681.1 AlNc14C76G5099 [Albugo laibachii Nc14]
MFQDSCWDEIHFVTYCLLRACETCQMDVLHVCSQDSMFLFHLVGDTLNRKVTEKLGTLHFVYKEISRVPSFSVLRKATQTSTLGSTISCNTFVVLLSGLHASSIFVELITVANTSIPP